jgi:hypothetical protein
MPFKHDEVQNQDKWGDFDPNDAQYTYLKQNITAINVIWLAGDRHFAALDDASQANDPWPVVLPGPAYPAAHEATGFYKVNGLDSVYDKTHEFNFMSFAIIEVGRDSVTVSIYDTKGNLINNGTRYLTMRIDNHLCNADFNNDGNVDNLDLSIFTEDFGRTNCSKWDSCEGDFDNDGDVDGSDLAVFAADFGRTDCLH